MALAERQQRLQKAMALAERQQCLPEGRGTCSETAALAGSKPAVLAGGQCCYSAEHVCLHEAVLCGASTCLPQLQQLECFDC
jgi:hypothetical protein